MKNRDEIFNGQELTALIESLAMEIDADNNGQDLAVLIQSLTSEKDRYKQEKLAQKIGRVQLERTAELVTDLLYSDDAYIRNLAIELLVALGDKALPALKAKLCDKDRNIRKFALDALKYINGKNSCKIALAALDDPDENVVEAALEVIAEQKYEDAAGKLLHILDNTSSVWVMNSILRTFEKLGIKKVSEDIADKIFSMNVSTVEKNILMNTFVRALGAIGSHSDIERILEKYSKDYSIDDENLVFSLCSLIVNNKICRLSEKELEELERVFKEHWDYRDSDHVLISITAFVQLQMDFFLRNIKEIYDFNKGEEFFLENLSDLLHKLDRIPASFIKEVLEYKEPDLVLMGLRLIYKKRIEGFNSIIEKLCSSQDGNISSQAIGIVAKITSYNNPLLLESLTDFSDEAEIASVESKCASGMQDVDFLLIKLEHPSRKVRKAVTEKLVLHKEEVSLEQLEEIVWRNPGEEGMEALEVLFRLNTDIGWKHVNTRMDSNNEGVRAGLISIVEYSSEGEFFSFMNTMINDPSPVVRKKAIKALIKKVDVRSLDLLEKLYNDESSIVNRMDIVSNLHKFKNDAAFDIVVAAASNKDTLTRIAAVRALDLFDNSRAEAVLQSLLEDPVEEVREAAKEALLKTEVGK
ncbi:HEAT repeat domain-containing protein [Petroclostridium sp. X23]|uniref:HEAT repeat domain-containing protein n=1 Tax=Petroclostridium sp. X23 TaxID=3045146 RepID=UPI0024AD0191|nr:HEAT repeat domain-containing protein [Petroclostridium sp. X23]WHH61363.1 HEAT repeat domain-containing protein [Petroclostridium sp. X23]